MPALLYLFHALQMGQYLLEGNGTASNVRDPCRSLLHHAESPVLSVDEQYTSNGSMHSYLLAILGTASSAELNVAPLNNAVPRTAITGVRRQVHRGCELPSLQ